MEERKGWAVRGGDSAGAFLGKRGRGLWGELRGKRLRVLERQSLGRRKEALTILGGDQPEWTKPSGTSACRER